MFLPANDSYFTIPSDLKQTFENKFSVNVGQNEIIKMKNNNIITDRDLAIAKFLFQFRFATADQIFRYLKESKTKINLQNRLDKLVKYRVLNKFMLSDIEEDCIAEGAQHIYCLDLGGRYLLSHYSNEDVSDWYTTVNMKASEIISKNIMVTEFYIRLLETCPDKLTYFRNEPEIRVGKKNVVPSFAMCIEINGQKKYMIGEIVRAEDTTAGLFRDKALKLESLICTNAWKKYYYDSQQPPILFAFGDSDLTALEAGKILAETTEISSFRLSTDDRIQKTLYDTGAFLKYIPDKEVLQEIKAMTFTP